MSDKSTENDRLTDKQQAFISFYLQSWNATQAAIAAGYSEKTARQMGSENLSKPDIQAEIQRRLTELSMSADEVLMRLSQQARGDVSQFLDQDGQVDMEKVRQAGYLVKKIKTTRQGTEIELYDGQSALSLLGKTHKLFVDKTELDVTLSITGIETMLDRVYGTDND